MRDENDLKDHFSLSSLESDTWITRYKDLQSEKDANRAITNKNVTVYVLANTSTAAPVMTISAEHKNQKKKMIQWVVPNRSLVWRKDAGRRLSRAMVVSRPDTPMNAVRTVALSTRTASMLTNQNSHCPPND